jgi:hypothetical protein
LEGSEGDGVSIAEIICFANEWTAPDQIELKKVEIYLVIHSFYEGTSLNTALELEHARATRLQGVAAHDGRRMAEDLVVTLVRVDQLDEAESALVPAQRHAGVEARGARPSRSMWKAWRGGG